MVYSSVCELNELFLYLNKMHLGTLTKLMTLYHDKVQLVSALLDWMIIH